MGWIWDAINNAISWVVDTILRPIINWITKTIDWVIAEIRALRHDLVKAIGKWLSNDFAFLLTFIAAIFVAVHWPAILNALKAAGSALLNTAIVQQIKEGLVKIIDVNKLIDLVFLNAILKIIWPDYLAITQSFAEAVSALAEELGEGSGYIHAYFAAQKGIVYGTNALLGNDPRLAEMSAYTQTADFFKKIDDRFRRYAHDPGLVVRDFLDEVLIPAAEDQRDAQQGLVSDVRENYNQMLSQEAGLKLVQDSVNTFIEEMPAEIASRILKHWAPINVKLELWIEYIDTELRPQIDGIITAAEQRAADQDAINAYAAEKLADPLNAMLNYELANEQQQIALRDHNLELTGQAMKEQAVIDKDQLTTVSNAIFTVLMNMGRRLPGPSILQYEPAEFSSLPTGKASRENWFIGEY